MRVRWVCCGRGQRRRGVPVQLCVVGFASFDLAAFLFGLSTGTISLVVAMFVCVVLALLALFALAR